MFKNNGERIAYYCKQGWCTTEQLKKYVTYQVITPKEYERISSEVYKHGDKP